MLNGQPAPPEMLASLDQAGTRRGLPRVMTGPVGQFVFHSLRKGSYRLSASAPGYVPGSYGQRRVNGPSKPIELDEGEHVGDATIKLWKYGAISGRVTDDAGEPAVGVSVRILRAQVSGPTKTYLFASRDADGRSRRLPIRHAHPRRVHRRRAADGHHDAHVARRRVRDGARAAAPPRRSSGS